MLDISRKLDDKLVIDDEEFPLNLSFDNVLRLFEMWRDEDVPEFVKPHFGRSNRKTASIVGIVLGLYQRVLDAH